MGLPNMKTKLVLRFLTFGLLFTICGIFPCFALSLEELVPADTLARLQADESIAVTQTRNPVPQLMPGYIHLQRQVLAGIQSLGPSVMVEALFLYNKPGGGSTSGSSNSWSEAQRTALFNELIALSTLTGIEYYSARRETMRTFYEISQVIDSPDTRNPVPDPVFQSPMSNLTIYANQKDLTFGDNIYKYNFETTGEAFIFTQENITPLTVGIIPAVGRNRLNSTFAILDCGDSLLIYALSMARAASVPGMADRIGASFGNRITAIYRWFTQKADKIF